MFSVNGGRFILTCAHRMCEARGVVNGGIACEYDPDFDNPPLSGTGGRTALQAQLMYYRRMRIHVLLLATVLGAVPIQGNQIGPSDPEYCYRIETIRPNLILREVVHLAGSIRDQTGAPLKNSPIELRKYISQRKQVEVRAISTDDNGHFDLGTAKPGNYRLLASPHRGFRQPTLLRCRDGKNCDLNIVLIVNPTDQLDSSCPIR